MRIGVVATRLPGRRELVAGPIDTELLLDLGHDHELLVVVDHETPGSRRVRKAGHQVSVAPKRATPLDGGRDVSSDEIQAMWLAGLHREQPMDCLIYGADVPVDLAWHSPALQAVPRGVALGGHACSDIRLVTGDSRLFARYGGRLWAHASLVASADFVVSNVDPYAGFRLRLDGHDVPRLAVGPAVVPLRPAPGGATWVAVIATTEDLPGLSTLVERTVEAVKPAPDGTIVVVTRDLDVEGEALGELVTAGSPAGRRGSVIVAPASSDGIAYDFVSRADEVVVATLGELAIPAIRAITAGRGVVPLDATGEHHPVGAFPEDAPPPKGEERAVLVPVDGPLSAAVQGLEPLLVESGADIAVLYDPAAGREALYLLERVRRGRHDVALLGAASADFGHATPGRVAPGAAAIHRRNLAGLQRWTARVPDLAALVTALADPVLADRFTLALIPAPPGVDTVPHASAAGLPTWVGDHGVLPSPLPVGPHPPAAPPAERTESADVRAWVRDHRWGDRVRLAFPQRWGLLARAMRGRW